MNTAADVQRALQLLRNGEKATVFLSFFKTGKGQYGEGDQFLGVPVPQQRKVAKQFRDLSFVQLRTLLASPIHEHRFTALEILVFQAERADKKSVNRIAKFYLSQRRRVNNWDLVDTSAPYILGPSLFHRSRLILKKLARSPHLWDRRIAMVTTQYFINHGDLKDTFELAKLLMNDTEDLMHKAVGWMLREAGKKDTNALKQFLDQYAHQLPRTLLRYAIERLTEKQRKHYLRQKRNTLG